MPADAALAGEAEHSLRVSLGELKRRGKKMARGVTNVGAYRIAHYKQADNKTVSVGDAKFSPDGNLLVTYDKSTKDGSTPTLTIRDTCEAVRGATFQSLHVLDRDRRFSEHAPTCFSFSPTGALLATGERDGRVLLWNAETGVLVLTMEDHAMGHEAGAAITDVIFSPSGLLIASADAHGRLVVWEPRFSKKVHPLVLRQLALFASGTREGTLPAVLQPVDDSDEGIEKYMSQAQTYDFDTTTDASESVVRVRADDPRLLELRGADSSLRSAREEIANEAFDRLEVLHKCFFLTPAMVRFAYRLPGASHTTFIQSLTWIGSAKAPQDVKLVGICSNQIIEFAIVDTARPPPLAEPSGEEAPARPHRTSTTAGISARIAHRGRSFESKKSDVEPLVVSRVTEVPLLDLEQGDVHRLQVSPDGMCLFISTTRGAKFVLPFYGSSDASAHRSLCLPLVAPVEQLRASMVSPVCMVTFAQSADVVVIGCWDGAIYVWDYSSRSSATLLGMWEYPRGSMGYALVPIEVQLSGKYRSARRTVYTGPSKTAQHRDDNSDDGSGDEDAPPSPRPGRRLSSDGFAADLSARVTFTERPGSASSSSSKGAGAPRANAVGVPRRVKGLDLDCMHETCNTLAWMACPE